MDQEIRKLSHLEEGNQRAPHLEPCLLLRFLFVDNSIFSSSPRAVCQCQVRQAKERRHDWGKNPHWVSSKGLSGGRFGAIIKLSLTMLCLRMQNLTFSTASCSESPLCYRHGGRNFGLFSWGANGLMTLFMPVPQPEVGVPRGKISSLQEREGNWVEQCQSFWLRPVGPQLDWVNEYGQRTVYRIGSCAYTDCIETLIFHASWSKSLVEPLTLFWLALANGARGLIKYLSNSVSCLGPMPLPWECAQAHL